MSAAAWQMRPVQDEDRAAVLALWERALPQWPIRAGALRERTEADHQLVAAADGRIAGYIAVGCEGEAGQVTAILVDPSHRRRGIGSALLADAWRAVRARGVRELWAGSGAGWHIWPGIPDLDPSGWAFFRARGFERVGAVSDLVADVSGFRAPDGVLARAGRRVRFAPARVREAGEILAFVQRHFPGWLPIYDELVELPGTVLTARVDGRLAGACTVEGPDDHEFLWGELFSGAVGALGCVGVDPAARGAGIGLAMVAAACELLSGRGATTCYCDYTDLEDWYAQLGFSRWRGYTLARAGAAFQEWPGGD